jgi:acyl-CoA hydrolase
MSETFNDVTECVDAAIRRVGRRIVLALPLGIGKPVAIADEFWRRALREPDLDLTILTALTLARPVARSELERRFLAPLVERVFGDYAEPQYLRALREGTAPSNARVIEFFVEPGSALAAPMQQQQFLCMNYTEVAQEIARRGVNIIAQLVAQRRVGGELQLSLGSNPDVTLDLLPAVQAARRAGQAIVCIAQPHTEMPFMLGHAVVPADTFDFILYDRRCEQALFAPPNPALGSVDHAIGLHVSALIADGGTLQVGIGELGDAICYALLLRQQQNAAWRQALRDVDTERSSALIDAIGGREPLHTGLFAATEMFVDQMLDLWRAGVLRRRVYDSLPLSRLIATGHIGATTEAGSGSVHADRFDTRILADLVHVGVGPRLSAADFEELRHYGVFRAECRFDCGRIRTPEGDWIDADLGDPDAVLKLSQRCLGRELRNGVVVQAGFLLGPRGFYAALRDLPEADRREFDLRGIGWINKLGDPQHELRVLQRRRARYVNTAMMVTGLGAAVSDGLEDGRVVSGVGGQYDFVAMSRALPDARSILCVRATRTSDGQTRSNLVWNYGHVTIPRQLRDIVVTEYGIADLRGRTDAECVQALLGICDSRFQDELLAAAHRAGKLPRGWRIPDAQRQNRPERLARALSSHRRAGLFSEYPFGTDLNDEEVVLARALRHLRATTATPLGRVAAAAAALLRAPRAEHAPLLQRLGLAEPSTRRELLWARLVARSIDLTREQANR